MSDQGEFLTTEEVEQLAKRDLPSHYRILRVIFTYGASTPGLPEQLEIRIEYQTHLDDSLGGTIECLNAHHRWADPLVEKIQAEWPPNAVRIVFVEKMDSNA